MTAVEMHVEEDPGLTRYSAWRPKWVVDVGNDCVVGIALDDACFVVLYPHGDEWRPGKHIPREAAERIARLLEEGVLN